MICFYHEIPKIHINSTQKTATETILSIKEKPMKNRTKYEKYMKTKLCWFLIIQGQMFSRLKYGGDTNY